MCTVMGSLTTYGVEKCVDTRLSSASLKRSPYPPCYARRLRIHNSSAPNETRLKTRDSPPEKKLKQFCYGLPGSTGPLTEFDPFNLLEGKDENTVKRWREAELTHGRVSMLATVGFLVGENFNPLFDGRIKGPAVDQWQQTPAWFQVSLLLTIGAFELTRAQGGWVPPNAGKGLFLLNDNYVPGDLGYDPLGIKPDNEQDLVTMQNKELNNGRLAMFGILGMIVQEKVSGKEILNLFDLGVVDENCPPGIFCDTLEATG